jgi:hypothetical protein
VDGNHCAQTRAPVVAVHDLLVVVSGLGELLLLEVDYDGGLSDEMSHLRRMHGFVVLTRGGPRLV